MEVIGQLLAPAVLLRGKSPSELLKHKACLGPRTFQDVTEKRKISFPFPGIELQFLGRLACNLFVKTDF